jgi:hypothetical protein
LRKKEQQTTRHSAQLRSRMVRIETGIVNH